MKKYFQLLRVEQYLKNLFVFSPLFFGKSLQDMNAFIAVCLGFVMFCLASSAVYIFNDYCDIAHDQLHPHKKFRPLASGSISIPKAQFILLLLLTCSVTLACLLDFQVLFLLVLYLIINILYSLRLKKMVLIDINCIAIGFVIRILIGAVLAQVTASVWIIMLTYLLALFLALSKRRSDVLLASEGVVTRKNIQQYKLSFVDSLLHILASIIVVCYIFYCIAPENEIHYHSKWIYLSIFFVINGIFRYLYITFSITESYSPTQILITDRFIQLTILCWVALMGYLLYFN